MSTLLLINCWSLLVLLSLPFLYTLALCHKKTKTQLRGRVRNFLIVCWQLWQRQRTTNNWLFFCSSAGEYEQAVPLLARLDGARQDKIILFFSQSGYRFAQLKREQATCLLAVPDLLWLWWLFFALCRPRAVIVVRHELWPAFLYAAQRWSKLYLINVSFPHLRHRWLRRWLLTFFTKIFVVTSRDALAAQQQLHVPAARLCVAGDSKYDRVAQRVATQTDPPPASRLLRNNTRRRRLLIGSAWEAEIAAVLQVYPAQRNSWQVLIAPHEPHTQMVSWIEELCRQKKIYRAVLHTVIVAICRY